MTSAEYVNVTQRVKSNTEKLYNLQRTLHDLESGSPKISVQIQMNNRNMPVFNDLITVGVLRAVLEREIMDLSQTIQEDMRVMV